MAELIATAQNNIIMTDRKRKSRCLWERSVVKQKKKIRKEKNNGN